ncbi:histidine kinase [Sulfoacidibacillus thermotolerans]|uniref:histidine kinase n=1 Tax=Sulfoacidibacillus thermotolerans TaxID=1765684 RepID=A0A2U3DAQ5_SULT2|nr:histidine kinase [Sulfoacidibacillus thermotolerans]PWI58364.1 hypothetical protein BM613_03865 [Sulfoacidibacillus thermotolerans]
MKEFYESERNFFQQMFERAIDAYIVLNKDLKITYMNHTAREWFGEIDAWREAFCGDVVHCQTESGVSMSSTHCLGCVVRDLHTSLGDRQMMVTKKNGDTISVSISYSYIPVSDDDMRILMSLRDISVQKRWENERLVNETLRFTLEERERIARDLHDTVAQNLAYATMQLKLLRKAQKDVPEAKDLNDQLQAITEVLDDSIKELRNSLYDLNFELDTDLIDFIRDVAAKLNARTGITVETYVSEDHTPWPKRIEVQLARIVQEILTNIRKHAQATRVVIHIERVKEHLSIRIRDNGRGFIVEEAENRKGHYGLRSIKERCRLIGGQAAVESEPGKGAVWRIVISADPSQVPLVLPQINREPLRTSM